MPRLIRLLHLFGPPHLHDADHRQPVGSRLQIGVANLEVTTPASRAAVDRRRTVTEVVIVSKIVAETKDVAKAVTGIELSARTLLPSAL